MPQQADHPVVVHTIGRLNAGGLEKRTLELLAATQQTPTRHIICVTSGKEGSLDEQFRSLNVDLHYIAIHRVLFPLKFYRMLKKEKVTTIHAYLMHVSGFIAMLGALAGVKNRIVQFRSDGPTSLGYVARVKTALLRILIALFATRIIGLTPQNLALAWKANWADDPRCRVVPSGVSMPKKNGTQPVEQFHGHDANTVIVHVGRGELETKNRARAIEIFSCVVQRNPHSALFFIGRHGKDESESERNLHRWQEHARSWGVGDKTYFLGERHDVVGLMSHADLLLVTSSLEGLPGVVLEALSAGLPVVSSDVPGSQYVAESCSWVKIRSLDDPDAAWVDTIEALPAKLSQSQRLQIQDEFSNTRFNLTTIKGEYEDLWRGV